MDNIEKFILPSQGIFYKNQFKDLKVLSVRKLNWEDEDILMTESYYKQGILYDEILKNVIKDENGFSQGMLVGVDREAILWWLRKEAFGSEYNVPMKCKNPDCKGSFTVTWNLDEFKTTPPSEELEEELIAEGHATITLPVSNLKVIITVPNYSREKEIDKNLKNKKDKTKVTKDFYSTARLIGVIKEAFDKEEKSYKTSEEILEWLRTADNGNPISLVDSRYILKKAKDISLNADTRQSYVCPHCEQEYNNIEMPMTIYFFWPDFDELT